jgi:type I restriction enzyme S subunit
MREMKDSEASWLGMIPTEWELKKINSLYSLRNTKVSDRDYSPLSVTMKGIVPQLENAAKTNAHDDRKLVKKGDFAINSRSDRRGSCGISDMDGSVSLINTVLKPNQEMNPKYYNWLFHTVQFADEFYANGHGIVNDLWTTTWQDMKKILTPSPPLEEQQCIANFLDEKCGEIDSLTKDIQEQIATLEEYKKSVITEIVTKGLDLNVEMKDSGIEWVGAIPHNWKVNKGKYCLQCVQKPVKKDDDVVTCFRDGEVTLRSKRREDGFTISMKEIGYQGIDVGDLIVHGMDGFAGAIGISDSRGKASPVLNVLETNNNKRYIMYYLRSMAYNGVFLALSTGIRVRTCDTNWSKLRELPYIIPSKNEQDDIVNYLDSKCSEIDAIIQTKKEQLETLAEYKKSLIYEYVTGKKEVPVNE